MKVFYYIGWVIVKLLEEFILIYERYKEKKSRVTYVDRGPYREYSDGRLELHPKILRDIEKLERMRRENKGLWK